MIYYKIKEHREIKNITIDFMADELCISSTHYINIEGGNIDLKLSFLFELSRILDVHPSKLFSVID